MKKIILFLFFPTLVMASSADDVIIQKLVDKHEREILQKLKDKNSSQDEVYKTYVIAANELNTNNSFKYARQFYKKALELKGVSFNQTKVYFSLINMDQKEEKSGRASFIELKKYLSNNPKMKNGSVSIGFNYYDVITSGKLSTQVLSKSQVAEIKTDTLFWNPLRWHDISVNLKEKKYKDARTIVSSFDMKMAPINMKIIADLVQVKTENGLKKSAPLMCEKSYERYPDSRENSYSMKLCQILLTLRHGKKIPKGEVGKLEALISKNAPSQKFLIDALK
ncbi:MAG: hypothetical protein KC493_05490 [Bacteriovoracaceae bacterium]|nr:hypothetical protein [Bacteriovoracaceae bacterium]